MKQSPLWKYNTPRHSQEMLIAMDLLAPYAWSPSKQLTTLYALANHLESHYEAVTIHKKNGQPRQLHVPDHLLKQVQRNILKLLDQKGLASCVSAYRPGAQLRENARPHIGQEQLLKLDIEDFFGSIQFTQVMAMVFPSRYYPPDVQMLLTTLCCYRECLPQGAPTSAAISNLVMSGFDRHMQEWCGQRKIAYTRYCDDMTFSGTFNYQKVIHKVASFLEVLGFNLNDQKTTLLKTGQRQLVTGIVVNKKMQAPRYYRQQLRQEWYYCQKFGVLSHFAKSKGVEEFEVSQDDVLDFLHALIGRVSFVLQVNPDDHFFQRVKEEILEELDDQLEQMLTGD